LDRNVKFNTGDKVRVLDRPGWPGGYQLANWEGEVVEVKEDPIGYVIVRVDKTGYDMAFRSDELEKTGYDITV
jgi:hypothetical protein